VGSAAELLDHSPTHSTLHTPSHIHPHSLTHTPTLPHTYTHTPSHIHPTLPHTYTPHSLTHTPTLPHTYTHTPSQIHPQSLTHTPTLPHTYTHTPSHMYPTLPHTERRHTVCYTTHKYPASAPTSRRSHDEGSDPTHLCYPETKADIQRALKGGSGKHTSCI